MTISIYDPRVRAEAQREGITELQAYRRLNAAETLRQQLVDRRAREAREARQALTAARPKFFDRLFNVFDLDSKISPDWDKY
jgi:uncharacterized protein (DUF2236 family)